MFSAFLFAWLQGAGFYRQLHALALSRVPPGSGERWIEVGCGPGLLSRLAAQRGFRGVGIDLNRESIWVARLLGFSLRSTMRFEVGTLESLGDRTADVVAASSLLAVLPDRENGLQSLWQSVAPSGYLLVIEPTSRLTANNVEALISSGSLPSKRIRGLRLWARARENETVDERIFDSLQNHLENYSEMLDGMVGIWIFRKP